jgi:hypothetical protein
MLAESFIAMQDRVLVRSSKILFRRRRILEARKTPERINPKHEYRSGAKRATFGTKSKMAPEAPQIPMTEIQNSKRGRTWF